MKEFFSKLPAEIKKLPAKIKSMIQSFGKKLRFRTKKGSSPNMVKPVQKGQFKTIKGFKLRNSILGKLSICFIAIITVALVLVGVFTYMNTKEEVKKQFTSSAREILTQNRNYVDFIVTTVDNYSMQLFSDQDIINKLSEGYKDEYEKYIIKNEIDEKLNRIILSNQLIRSIYILNPDGVTAGEPQINIFDLDDNKIRESSFYKKAKELSGKNFWMPAHNDEFGSDKDKKVISHVRLLRDFNSDSDFGALKINISPEVFQEALSKTKIGKDGYIYIMDSEGNIISHPENELLGTNIKESIQAQKILSSESESGEFTYDDENKKTEMFTVFTKSKNTGWSYIAVVPNRELTAAADDIRNTIILLTLICLAIAMAASIVLSLAIVNPIKQVNTAMDRVKNGDLTVEVSSKSKSELGELGRNFNDMVNNLKELVSTVKSAVEETNNASGLIESSSQQLAASTTEVSRVIEEIASGAGSQAQQASKGVETADGFGKEVETVVEYSGEVQSASMDAMDKAERGMKSVTILRDKSEDSVGVIRKVSDSISELSENTREIEDILSSIKRISQQTNLLSLNAAIEAARAGEAGKGFAVVADEVRKLADESKQAVDNINNIIKNVNSRTKDSVETSKSITIILEEQVKHINDTMEVFDSIKGSIDIVGDKLDKLNGSLNNIGKGKDRILRAIEEISAISQETAASTEEISASAEEQAASVEEMNSMASGLNSVSTKLKELTDRFII